MCSVISFVLLRFLCIFVKSHRLIVFLVKGRECFSCYQEVMEKLNILSHSDGNLVSSVDGILGNLFQSVESFLGFFDQLESLVSGQSDDTTVSIVIVLQVLLTVSG